MFQPSKGHAALRKGRTSLGEATYFITICVDGKTSGLEAELATQGILTQAGDPAHGWNWRAAVVMPDHIHLVIDLMAGKSLSEVMRSFKGRTSVLLRQHSLKWQRGYYDHRLRTGDDLLPVFLYIFLNPYRAGLCQPGQSWPGYRCAAEDWKWLEALTNNSLPFPEWLR